MHQYDPSYDYYEEATGCHHGSRHELRGYYKDCDDGYKYTDRFGDRDIDSYYCSQQGSYHGMQGTSTYVDDKGSNYHFTHNEQHRKRRGSHYMDNVGSYYHSTHEEHQGKQCTHHHLKDKGSDYHSPHRKHPSIKSTHHHNDKNESIRPKSHHKNSTGKKELRERLFQQALQPFNESTGTPYPCSQTDIYFHRQKNFSTCNKGPFVTSLEATKEVVLQNESTRTISSSERAAIANLLSAASSAEDGLILGPDIAIKAFKDLDLVFFAGRLHSHVTVQWRPDIRHPARAWGMCEHPRWGEEGQCRIHLNADLIFKQAWTKRTPDPFESMIGTLLHEMCHAYEDVRSPRDIESGDGHGKLFGTRIAVVHKRALRILGLWAIERGELHKQHHFFMPGCLEGQNDDHDGEAHSGNWYGDGGNGKVSGKHGSNGKFGSSDKRKDGLTKNDKGKKGDGSSKAGGSSKKSKRQPKRTDCVIM